jgi:hypothetical protein
MRPSSAAFITSIAESSFQYTQRTKLEGPLLVGLASDEGLGRGAHGRSGPTGLGRHRLVDVWQAVDPRNCARRKGVTSGIPSGPRSLVTPD